MTTAHTLQRSIIVWLAALGVALTLTNSALAGTSTVPDDVVVVSSTEVGSSTFMMTATNLGELAADLDLVAPGNVSNVDVDLGSYGGRWTIDGLEAGSTATMTGMLIR